MRSVPWWALLSSASAPILLVGGWSISAALQGPSYDPAAKTISVLASNGAAGYWVMTSALIALGVCHVITAWGLHPAALLGRLALAGGGLTAMLLALFPVPSSGGSLEHGAVVSVGFSLLALWPALAMRRGAVPQVHAAARGATAERNVTPVRSNPSDRRRATGGGSVALSRTGTAPWGLRPGPSLMATASMWLGGAWFLLALFVHDTAGAAERVLTFAQSFWPLVVVVSCVRQTNDDEGLT